MTTGQTSKKNVLKCFFSTPPELIPGDLSKLTFDYKLNVGSVIDGGALFFLKKKSGCLYEKPNIIIITIHNCIISYNLSKSRTIHYS